MTPHVKMKSGAAITRIAPAGIRILAAIDRASQLLDAVLTITSGSEEMGRNTIDPHMTGEAFDLSVHGLEFHQTRRLYRTLRTLLGAEFTVLLECPGWLVPTELKDLIYVNDKASGLHLHIQRKKGTVWPPPTT